MLEDPWPVTESVLSGRNLIVEVCPAEIDRVFRTLLTNEAVGAEIARKFFTIEREIVAEPCPMTFRVFCGNLLNEVTVLPTTLQVFAMLEVIEAVGISITDKWNDGLFTMLVTVFPIAANVALAPEAVEKSADP